jgi:hypothetical protein
MPRTLDEQHTMVQHAIDSARDASMLPDYVERRDATRAAMHNQQVQALTMIALELRALRVAVESVTGSPRYR